MSLPSVEKLERLSDATLATFRDSLLRHAFLEETIEAVDRIVSAAAAEVRLPIVRVELARRTEPGFRLALLLSYSGELARSEVETLFGEEITAALIDAGFLLATGPNVRCPFHVVPAPRLWILSDTMLDELESVMPPGPTTGLLARVMPEEVQGSVLDVGCGPGSLALAAAARGAKRVLGTDINPRAIAMARFNARWNGLTAEFRVGDLIEPAAGERFDLLVSQPPFVTHPPGVDNVQFLHGGPRGDELLLRLLAGAERALTPEGEALMLSEVGMRSGDTIGRYLEEQVGEHGLHVLALHVGGVPADTFALLYSRFGLGEFGRAYIQEVQQQRAHLQSQGIEAFRLTLFIARRPGPARREAWLAEFPARELIVATPAVRARLWECLRSAGESDAVLLRRRIRVAPDAQWMSLRRAPEGEQTEHRVRFGDGWPALEQIVTDEGLALASLLERSETVEEAIAGYAEMCEAKPHEVRGPLLTYIRQSLRSGMLAPEENGRER